MMDPQYDAKRHLKEACIEIAKNKGYGDAAGLLRGILFLAKEPISLDELTAETGYSKSTVSANMSFLEQQGLARRVVTPGDKRYRYVPVTDPNSLNGAMIANLLKEVLLILKALEQTEKDLRTSGSSDENIMTRIAAIRSSYQITQELLEIISRYSSEEMLRMLKGPGIGAEFIKTKEASSSG
ncbi:Putative HTH-type transcriptional regulator [uncultured archaeon]|nr:Putative HTH-type transcriptional regulator [uncultured archaeon]